MANKNKRSGSNVYVSKFKTKFINLSCFERKTHSWWLWQRICLLKFWVLYIGPHHWKSVRLKLHRIYLKSNWRWFLCSWQFVILIACKWKLLLLNGPGCIHYASVKNGLLCWIDYNASCFGCCLSWQRLGRHWIKR